MREVFSSQPLFCCSIHLNTLTCLIVLRTNRTDACGVPSGLGIESMDVEEVGSLSLRVRMLAVDRRWEISFYASFQVLVYLQLCKNISAVFLDGWQEVTNHVCAVTKALSKRPYKYAPDGVDVALTELDLL